MKNRGQDGIALLLTVWLLAVLAVVAGEFIVSGRVKLAAERNTRDGLQAYALAQAGYRAALAALDADITQLNSDESGRLLLHYRGEEEGVPAEAEDVALGEGTYSWTITDESGKVSINSNTTNRQVLTRLLTACGMELGADRDTAVDSILDWRDPNRDHRLNGAEEDYYQGLDPPYSCKDGSFDVVEELRLVRGITGPCFTGGEEDGKTRPGLRDLVTTAPVTEFNPNTASQDLRDALDQSRDTQPRPISSFFSVVAVGKTGTGEAQRALRAVVRREGAGSRSTFKLLYWNDNYVPD